MNREIVKHTTKKAEETARVAKKIARAMLKKGRQPRAVIVGLFGELGAGKTTFAKAFAKELGVEETVVSPTFILERIYRLRQKNPFSHFVHIDVYRLEGARELLELGLDELVANPKNLIMIEWAEKIEKLLPKDAIKIYFEHKGKDTREIRIGIWFRKGS